MKLIRNIVEIFARRKGAKNKNETTIVIDMSKGQINSQETPDPITVAAPAASVKTEFSAIVTKAN